MNKYLNQLVQLSTIDQEIDDFGPRIEKIERALNGALDTKQEAQLKLDELVTQTKEAQLKRSQHELHLAELSDKIKDIAKKVGAIKSEKEQKALQLEEEICKEQCDFSNEEIERLDKIIESKNGYLEEAKAHFEAAEQKVEAAKVAIASEMESIDKERASVYAKKEQLVGQMSQKILTFYEKIRKWAKNTAVVPVRKQACYGCFMRINDKTYAAVLKGEDIVTCPHCGRILYKEAEAV
ncbi:zinc ribbon domain-containing protein [Sulfurospirillum sp. T05]|uniref:Zinc ribbon domain-containing protein n=1 Tax=Sulfurospirillum tamanense TaxID=2813362 RepID=A0ABS2WT86_9BACT|nr:zinc ribbon domain-containing protein [Sulfurospirillum tamanensis]MBN2964855.1 zinc ribbon domain-containing protein [Sulfurospirillum tamanensis]